MYEATLEHQEPVDAIAVDLNGLYRRVYIDT